MSLLRLSGVVREIGAFVILDRIDAAIAAEDRIGLVGPNGAGKTTLLRVVAGLDEPDRGDVQRRRGLSVGLLSQEAHFDAAVMTAPTLREAVRDGAGELERLERELADLERAHQVTGHRYSEIQHRFEALGGYSLDQRVDETLSGLGFAVADRQRSPTSLSGGEQTRAALARLVIADPELLLLDEPTNHLDIDALEWLEEHLRRRHGSLVVASHDRAFLDATVNRVWELRDRRLTSFRGDYSSYHRQREERDVRASKERETHELSIGREQELVQRYRSQRKFSKMHEHEARLERLQDLRQEAPRRGRRLALPTAALAGGGLPSRSGQLVVELEGVVVGYATRAARRAIGAENLGPEDLDPVEPGRVEPVRVARVPWLVAQRGERIGIVGPNGAGKTTLLRTIAGELPPLDGRLGLGLAVQIGYLAQLRDVAIPGATVLDAITEAMPITAGEARSYLARFLFRGDDVLKEVRMLSGGERSRLELALLGILPSNLLLLDEPTNHLDIPAREAIEAFLRETPATVLVVSHDRRLLETVCERLWVVDDGLAVSFDGGWRAWRAALAEGWTTAEAAEQEARRLHRAAAGVVATGGSRIPDGVRAGHASTGNGRGAGRGANGRGATPVVRAAAPGTSPAEGSGRPPGSSRAPASATRTAARPKLSKDAYRRQKATVDAELDRLGLRKSHLELALSDPATAANFVELRRVTSELADVEQALAAAEEAWLELEERAP